RRDNQLSGHPMRDLLACAPVVKKLPAAGTKTRFQRAHRIIERGVDHAAISAGDAFSDAGAGLENKSLDPSSGKNTRHSETYDSGSDDNCLIRALTHSDGPMLP